jgi:glycosyltransferase involved in cell wall biosynthesis
MSDARPRLGICIPTYNRPDQFERCLTSVILSAKNFNVPIFISDNASNASNKQVVTKLRSHYPHIFYSQNSCNIGAERNIIQVARSCNAEFCWLLGDDDRMEIAAVKYVLNVLNNIDDSISFVFANYCRVDASVSKVLHEKSLPLEHDLIMEAEEFFMHYGPAMSFIGSCIFRRDLLDRTTPETYYDTQYVHVGTIMEGIVDQKVYICSESLVRCRIGNAGVTTWYEDYWKVVQGWDALVDKLADFYSPKACRSAKEAIHQAFGVGTLRCLCGRRADKLYNFASFLHDPFLRVHWKGTKRIGALFIALLPPSLLKIARDLWQLRRYRRCRSIEDVPLFPEKDAVPSPAFTEIAPKEA